MYECNFKPKSYVLHSFESLCTAMWADHLLGRWVVFKLIKNCIHPFMVGCVLLALWPVELCTPAYGRWVIYIYMLCFASTGLICKACSLGLVHFTWETLSVSFQKFCSVNGPDPLRVRALQMVSEQRFWDLRLRPESCISYRRLGDFISNYEVCAALVVTVLRASNVLLLVLNGVSYG